MRIERIRLREIAMPLRSPFVSAHGTEHMRHLLIVEATQGSTTGFGEVSALATPFYTEETHRTARLILESFLIPIALQTEWEHPGELAVALGRVRRHHMAKAGLEAAAWDLYAKYLEEPLFRLLGGTRSQIPVGVAVGLERDLDRLRRVVEQRLSEGYLRIKVKVEPGWDLEPLNALRRSFGDIPLMADANASYTTQDINHLRRLDDLGLLMIEQPFSPDDLVEHAKLQAMMSTPICLDESIESFHDARQAIALESCRIISIKPARVGGLSEAVRIHDLCSENGIPVWCGGMLESGIGRAHSIALASLPGFTLPADLSASRRYWHQDLIEPEILLSEEGHIAMSTDVGIGYSVVRERLDAVTLWTKEFY